MVYTTTHIQRLKRLLLLTMGIMAASMAYYVWRYNTIDKPTVRAVAEKVDESADVAVSNVSLTEMSHDQILWKLDAKEARIYSERKETVLTGVMVDFYDDTGQKTTHLISDRGVKDDKSGNIVASGNVEATSFQDGIVLKTDELMYDAALNKIVSDKHVVIERGDMIISGDGLESNLSLTEAKILRNINTTFKAE